MELSNTTAIILAAGKGTRMGGDIPKVLCEVHGRPLIMYLLDTLTELGIRHPVVVVNYKQELVRSALANYPVTFVDQGEPRGTGHAPKVAQSAIDPSIERTFVLYGDTPFISKETLAAVHDQLDDASVACALVTAPKTEQTERFGRIVRSDTGDLESIIEYKNATDEERSIDEVNVGGYCVRLPWFWQALNTIKANPLTNEYYLTDIVKIALDAGQRVVPVKASVRESHGVDTPELLAHAHTIVENN